MNPAVNILRMVRQQCVANGVKFTLTNKCPEMFGLFDSTNKVLTVSTQVRKHPNNKTVRDALDEEKAIVALHELVHLWQWKRKDPRYIAKINGEDVYSILSEYSDGDVFHSKSLLKKCLPTVAGLEFEAETTSIRIAYAMGLRMRSYSKWIKESKAYCYAWYVLVETGMWPSSKLRAKWRRHLPANLDWDLTKSLLSKLCSITIENKHLAATIWDGRKCIKK